MAHHESATATAQKRKCPDPDEETAGLCANRCGFFGAAATGGMCSKCYLQEHAATAVPDTKATTSDVFGAPDAPRAPPEKKAKIIHDAASSADGAADPSMASVTMKQPPPATNRCATCRKKVGLLGFRCRCEGTFCSAHRYSDKHACGFDYKAEGQEQIAKHNPVVVADKIATRI